MSQINTLGPVGYNPTGEYDETHEYERLDVVYYEGSSYVALQESIGQLPTNTEYWDCIAVGYPENHQFDTVAIMKSKNLLDGDIIRTLGYYEINDGGSALYKIVDSVDSSNHQETLNNGLYATLIIEEEVNVKQLGAKGDGTTDDTSAIQKAINLFKTINIPNGNYKISTSLKLKNGVTISGENVYNTTITTSDDISIFENGQSSNYITIENLKLISTNNSSTKYAIDIKGSISSPYTGATYSTFKNITIDNFESGMFFNHIWNTKINDIRIIRCTTNGIFLGGGCNNVEINMPMIENCVTGIRLTTSDIDTTQNTNIIINNADIEYCTRGIYLYNDETISINNTYSEHNDLVVYSYGSIGVKIDNFYSSYDTKYGEFSDSNVSVRNGFIRINNNNDIGMFSINNFTTFENITGNNLGTGKMFFITNDVNSYTPLIYDYLPYNIESSSFRLRYSSDKYDGTFDSLEKNDKDYSCFKPCLIVTSSTLTATSGDTIRLLRNGNVIATLSINNGTELTNGKKFEFSPSDTNAKNFIYNNGDEYSIQHTNTTGVDVNFKVVFQNTKKGNFIMN